MQSVNIWNDVDVTTRSAPQERTTQQGSSSTFGGTPLAIGPHPLFLAVEEGNLAKVKDLVLRGSDVEIKDFGGRTLLHRACELGQLEIVQFLLDRKGGFMTAVDRRKWTALHFSIAAGDMEISKALVESISAIANVASAPDGNRPLHFLCNFAQTDSPLYEEVFYSLIESGADVNAKTQYGETPLHIACVRLNSLAIQALLKHNASTWIRNKYGKGETCLHIAAKQGNLLVLRLLLQAGADPTLVGPEGTPREVARMYNHSVVADEIDAFLYKLSLEDPTPSNLYLPATPTINPVQLSSKARSPAPSIPRQPYPNLYNHGRSQTYSGVNPISMSTPNILATATQSQKPPITRPWQTTLPQGYRPHQPQLQSHLQSTSSTSALPTTTSPSHLAVAPPITPPQLSPRTQPTPTTTNSTTTTGSTGSGGGSQITWQQVYRPS
eukprot:TRINITY_DN4752_c0_g1_i1.p1 TRINITY_DN4752_c0_g1~~TRINITY_DN4752_c0_g1_i1.p1  ORF type:complete len:439 (+),score=71.70 TRINITY_DN4752_c0_g1_i1:260-1576(+)